MLTAWGESKLNSSSDDLALSADRDSNRFEVSNNVRSKMPDVKLGSPHLKHSHDTFFRAKYMWSPIPMQSWWYHNLHESHCTPGVLHFTAFWHIPQGNFGGLWPGFDSGAYDSARSSAQRYTRTSLYLFWFGALQCQDELHVRC